MRETVDQLAGIIMDVDAPQRLMEENVRLRSVLTDLAISADTADLMLRQAGYVGMADSLRGHVTVARRALVGDRNN